MKIKALILVSFLVLIPIHYIYATSGACSSHSGVNCNAGASYSGNVQCNDGWINSSVYFSDAEECKISVDYCPKVLYFPSSCNSESDYTNVKIRVDGMSGTQGAINARRGLLGSSFDTSSSIGQDELDSCRKSIELHNAMVSSRNKCLEEDRTLREIKDSERNKYLQEELTILRNKQNFQIDLAFQKYFKQAIDILPEYKDIVDPIVMKELSLKPENSNKTFPQLIIETYGIKLPAKTLKNAVSTSTTPSSINFSFQRNLKIGMSGDDVKQLQVFLQKLKYLPLSHVPSIYFGPITNKALIKFQKDNKIYPASGYFATSSQSKLIELIK